MLFKSILCVVDMREECSTAVERAVSLAEANQADLTVIGVVERITAGIGMPEGGPISADLQSKIEAAQAQILEMLVDPYRKQIPITTRVHTGTCYLEIIRQVLSGGHDLVIKVPEKLAWLDRLLGSDDMNLLRECPCPVWLLKLQEGKPYKRILAAVDVDDTYPPVEFETRDSLNHRVLEMAGSLALSNFAELHVVNAWRAIGESHMRGAFIHAQEAQVVAYVEEVRRRYKTNMDKLMRKFVDNLDKKTAEFINPQSHLVKGWARKEIPAFAQQLAVDVIVMGTVARTGVPGFLMGNTAEMILNQIDCSVLALKPPGFETPVTVGD